MAGKKYENPLLSNARLREMYSVMLEARELGKHRAAGRGIERGMEASWTGTAIGLRDGVDGDFVSAGKVGAALDRMLGLKLRAALRGEIAPKRLRGSRLKTGERIWFSLGIAHRMVGEKTVGIVYAGNAELSVTEWTQALNECQQMELPVVLVTLPAKADAAGTAALAGKCGVAGIPVDASDAVAMYRVAQESIGRARAGGGPALIEAVRFPGSPDPLLLLRKQLIAKNAATERWADALEQTMQRRFA